MSKCLKILDNGQQCPATAALNSVYCSYHQRNILVV